LQFSEFFCYLDRFESIVAEVKSYELELGGECLLGEEVGGERVVGQVQQQQALQALHVKGQFEYLFILPKKTRFECKRTRERMVLKRV
jgi:hypothetical protein